MLQKSLLFTLLLFLFVSFSLEAQNYYLKYSIIDSTTIEKDFKKKIKEESFLDFNSLLLYNKEYIAELQKKGYLEAKHLDLIRENDSTFISPIYIGRRTHIVKLKIEPKLWPNPIAKKTGVEKIDTLSIEMERLEKTLSKIRDGWKNHGYSFTEIQIQNISTENNILYGDLIIHQNELRKIDSILIKGYENFPAKVLKYKYNLSKNKRLDQDEIRKISQAVETMGLAKETKAPEILFEQEKSTIYFYFEKQNSNYFDGIIGFATNEESGKLEFNGNLDLSLYNNLNQAEKLNLNYRADGNSQQELRINIETPFFANTPITPSAGIHIFKKDSTYSNTNLDIKLKYNKKDWAYYIGFEQHKSVDLLQVENNTNQITSLNGHFFFTGASHSTYSNDPLHPEKSYLDIKLGKGKRETYNDSEGQYKIELESFRIFPILKNHSFFAKAIFKKLWSPNYYSNELFRMGGIDNIRGFNENSIDASTSYALQTEYRLKVSNELYLHSITDIGRANNKALNINQNLIGIGFGIGILNKIGLMQVQIANSATNKESFDFDKTRIHISLQAKF